MNNKIKKTVGPKQSVRTKLTFPTHQSKSLHSILSDAKAVAIKNTSLRMQKSSPREERCIVMPRINDTKAASTRQVDNSISDTVT